MPTFTAIALESLLEPNIRNNSSSAAYKQHQHQQPTFQDVNNNNDRNSDHGSSAMDGKRPSHRIFISPALYATPTTTPIPGSPTCVSPSPYVVNHKRRGIRPSPPPQNPPVDDEDAPNSKPGSSPDGPSVDVKDKTVEEDEGERAESLRCERVEGLVEGGDAETGEDLEDFYDPRDSMSVVSSSSDADDGGSSRRECPGRRAFSLGLSEFYDADEEFFSDSCSSQSPSLSTKFEAELRSMKLNLLDEIGRRKKTEESLACMQNNWRRITKYLIPLGLSFPETLCDENAPIDENSIEQICQELVVAKFVSEATGKAEARAEAEAAAESIIDAKNHEINRLRDRLQRCEDVNREMSQRNQEIVELVRQKRRRRKARQRWIWSCIGLSITIGASMLAYSYLPHLGKSHLPAPDHVPDVSASVIEESISSDPVM
ncbi:hypothetical protein QJS10_CPA16g01822 [Acorus calamus]|uniref:Uncharacterized protein n=1 Tax=Acorus calamus TaxID=4465 RepID=A0AAV9D4H0_ACOCL|nr:hypothetical protein QJS10_CPA16g01822 [Acorus calamus]